jgi:DNA-binding beta-propeller fold protein YncE
VTDTGDERVEVFGLDGSFHRAWGGTGSGPNQFIEPVGIAVSPAGQVFVADSGNARISIFDTQGAAVAQWQVPEWQNAQFFEPYLVFDQNGLLYASSPQTGSVLAYDSDGNVVDTLTDAEGMPLQLPAGMAVSPTNELYIADRGASEIYTIDLGAISGAGEQQVTGSPVASPQASPVGSPAASPAASPSANG